MANELATTNVTHLSAQHPGARQVSSWRGVRPTSMDEAWRMSKALAMSGMLPSSYTQGKKYDEVVGAVFAAIQMGAEVGLSPMASIQNIAVINGKPGLYGPAMLAVVEASGLLQSIQENVVGTMEEKNMEAVCTVQRYGRQARTFTFSYADALLAGLIGKKGPWSQYPKRMFIARSRTFALRDTFPDVLAGLSQSVEELIDIPAEDYKEVKIVIPPGESMDDLLSIEERTEDVEAFEKKVKEGLGAVADLDALDAYWRSGIGAEVRKIGEHDKAVQKRIVAAFSLRKNEIVKANEAANSPADDDVNEDADEPTAPAEAPQKPVQADVKAAAAKPRDQIDNALDALRSGDDAPAGGIPAPAAIKVMVGADGTKNWLAFFNSAKVVFREAVDGEYGEEWLAKWLDANGDALAELKQVNPAADQKLAGMYAQAKDYFVGLKTEAEAEANKEFPTLKVEYKGENPDWPAFLRTLHGYLDDTPNHRIAAAWWNRHKYQVTTIMAQAGEIEPGVTGAAAAAEFTKALTDRFPQIAG